MENIITVNNQQYKIESSIPLSQEQMKEYVLQKIYNTNTDITTLATCPSTSKNVNQTLTLTSTPTGGTAPYTVEFRRNNSPISGGYFSGVPEGSSKSINYTLTSSDIPSVNISVYITDSCPSGAKNNTDNCVITVTEECNIPGCGFTVS